MEMDTALVDLVKDTFGKLCSRLIGEEAAVAIIEEMCREYETLTAEGLTAFNGSRVVDAASYVRAVIQGEGDVFTLPVSDYCAALRHQQGVIDPAMVGERYQSEIFYKYLE